MRTVDRTAMLLIGLVFGAGIGFVVAAGAGVTLDGHDHGTQAGRDTAAGGHAEMHEAPVALPEDASIPTLALDLRPDPLAGWNLHVVTEHFAFAPEKAGATHVPGEGHAHVYVDGGKIARLYGPWMHIPSLPQGATVEVTLNANDHRPLSADGQVVASAVQVPEG
jgi:hypothetical protein